MAGKSESNTPVSLDADPSAKGDNARAPSSGAPGWRVWLALATTCASLAVITQHYQPERRATYWVHPPTLEAERSGGTLEHVHVVLKRLGWKRVSAEEAGTDWSLLWSHSYPYNTLRDKLKDLPAQKIVNHIPGIGFLANKVELATTRSEYTPMAFRLPKDRQALEQYIATHPRALFLEKHNEHRGVRLSNASELLASATGDKFAQELVHPPLLISGHKFDIGIYVAVTSFAPLRAYWYAGDVLLRFCPEKYEPLDPVRRDAYVIADDYLPAWEVPALAALLQNGYSFKSALDAHLSRTGVDTEKMWQQVRDAITWSLLAKQPDIVRERSRAGAFEMLRFDLVLDANLRAHLLEANMSPNLSSAHFSRNRLLYEQLLYSLFSLLRLQPHHVLAEKDDTPAGEMVTSRKSTAVWPRACVERCGASCEPTACAACPQCATRATLEHARRAHAEHLHRADFRRLFPRAMEPVTSIEKMNVSGLSEADQISVLWYQGKCNEDPTWCT